VSTALAALLLLFTLLLPDELSRLTPAAFVRIPVEALVAIVLVLILPPKARRVVAVIGGLVLGLLTVLKILDMGFLAALSRKFDPILDLSVLADAEGFIAAAIGRTGAIAVVVGAVLLFLAVLVLVPLSALRLTRLVVNHRGAATRTVAILAPIWIVCAVLGVQIVPGVPVASGSTATFAETSALQTRADLRDQQVFSAALANDPYAHTPGSALLTGLRGKNVVLCFVESYGRVAVEDPQFGPRIDALLDNGTRQLQAAGFGSRSAFMTSPTAGGGSWLAQSTLLSGLWINTQQRFNELEASHRLTLTRAFHEANWRTIGVMPGVTAPWPQASFYGYDQVYDAHQLGYHGPSFSFDTIPDQYTLAQLNHIVRATPNHAPVMAMMPLLSSHAPWSPLPRMVGWNDLGDGSVFKSMAGPDAMPQAILTRDPGPVRAGYFQSIDYTLSSLISYVQNYGDDNLVLVFLGDHQPAPVVAGVDASHDVPITIVTRDQTVLDRVSGWGWQDGLRPGPKAPVWRMDAFRDRFLTAFRSQTTPTAPPLAARR
jgi:hypothetical protein